MKRLFSMALLCVGLSSAHAVELLRWDRVPLEVSLVVDQERVIFVDRPVRVGMPALLSEQLRVQSAGGALYLRANTSFDSTRVQLQDTETGALILLDVSARAATDDQKPLEPVRIVEPGEPTTAAVAPDGTLREARASESPTARATPLPVILTRYAAQSLYAPLRTVGTVAGIVRAPLARDLALETLFPSLPVQARALAAWRLEDYWLTAISLKNTAGAWIDLDPRGIQGDFVAATFQHSNLGTVGTPEDTTVLYLVTRDHGLAESLLPMIHAIDPATNLPRPSARAGGRDEK